MNLVSIATLLIFTVYLTYTGVLPSISDSYRHVNKAVYHLFFSIVCLLVWSQSIYVNDGMDIAYGIAGLSLFIISIAASFWKDGEKTIHLIATYCAILVGELLTVVRVWPSWGFYAIFPLAFLVLASLWLHNKRNGTYWTEVIAVVIIFAPII